MLIWEEKESKTEGEGEEKRIRVGNEKEEEKGGERRMMRRKEEAGEERG